MNIVLDVNVVLDLLLKRRSKYAEQAHCFTQLAKAEGLFWFPVGALPTLD